MLKRYRVTWRTPDATGEREIQNDNFAEIGYHVLRAMFPPPGCPTEIIKIELIEDESADHFPPQTKHIPVEHLAGLGEVRASGSRVVDRLRLGLRVKSLREFSGIPIGSRGEVVERPRSWPETDSIAIAWRRRPDDKLVDWFSYDELELLEVDE